MSRTVSYEEVLDISQNGGAILIDVREVNEIEETGLIPKSLNIPMNQVLKELNAAEKDFLAKYNVEKPKNDTYIVITCRSGRRAEIIMNDLEKEGYKNCKYYAGSWLEWASKNGK
ncbi:rhodanese domain-containing protein CG4456-like [Arctopsyche grandis]|uniref:rhodanese domain-containing protein CG4456-like n=1 Tax=Arctopsyche grandis TaxID=121162 RepID=UPI00406D7D2F